ncbi:hypothetical protein KPL70_013486 [Citrus sinensis]|nr:hypothetical protein KPL70_013486 [Citrus sinensis]
MASPATDDGNRATPGDRPATGDSYWQPYDYGANYRSRDFLSAEEEEKIRREDPPRKSLRKPPKFTRDPPPDMVEPPPRPRTRRSKNALNQRPATHTPDATQPHPVPPTIHISEPPISSISEPSTTPTSVILSKLCQPVNVQEKGVEKGEETQNTSSIRPILSSGNIHYVQESGQVVNQKNPSLPPSPCSGNTQKVQENGRDEMLGETHNLNNMHGGQPKGQTQEKVEEIKENHGQNPSSPSPPSSIHEQAKAHATNGQNVLHENPSHFSPSPSTISVSTIPLPPPIFAPHSSQHPHTVDPTPPHHPSTSTFPSNKISHTTPHPNILIPHLPLSPTQPNTHPPPVVPTPLHHASTSTFPQNTNTFSYTTHVSPTTSSHPPHTLPHISTNPIPPPQAQNNTLNPQAQTPPQSTTSNKAHHPNLSHPAHNQNQKENTHLPQAHNHPQHPPNSGPTYASILKSDPNPNRHKPLKRSFADIINGPAPPTVPIKSVSSFEGEPSVHFSADEVQAMAAPFKLTLVGKFSHNRPRLELIRKFFASLGLLGKSQISLLDNRHVLINLHVEEDYTRLWVKQTWYVCGSAMRIFKWTTDFLCSEESPVVPVWISFPYLPIHFVQCKEALFSIASAIGQPLRIDQATASLSRPSVARVLVEHDVTQPLLPRIRIGVGDSGFWQNVVYEKIPLYCASCKHLGHAAETCYVANPGLRPQRPNRAPPANPHTSKERAAPPPGTSPRAPDPTPEHSSLAIQIVDSVSPITMIFPVEADVPDSAAVPDLTPESQDDRAPDPGLSLPCDHGEIADHHIPSELRSFSDDLDTTVVGFNTHCTDVPYDVEISDAEDQHFGYGGTHQHSEHQSGKDRDSDHLLDQDVYFFLHMQIY